MTPDSVTVTIKSGKRPSKQMIDKLAYRIENYKQFIPWPALIESLERDLATLKERRAKK